MKTRLRWLLCFFVLFSFSVFACRYSVRDTGFVDLGDEAYELVLSGSDMEELAALYRDITAASLLDANIVFAVRDESRPSPATLTLVDHAGRRLPLAGGDSLPTDLEGATTLVESVALSPLRARIHEASLDAFAVVVLVEGTDFEYNLKAASLIEAAIRNIAQIMPTMPKPVDTPPALIRVKAAEQVTEAVTLWGLGLDPNPSQDPRVAIVFGRGRRIGKPLLGPLITQTAVQDHLAIIGQDCECELDREWMKGPLLPARWDADRQRTAVQTLGFDPENPMVRAEVSRIVLRGEGERQLKKLSGGSSVLGYSEIALDEAPGEAVVALEEPEPGGSAVTDEAADAAATPPDEGGPATQAVVNPVERSTSVIWWVAGGGGLLIVVLASVWWRRIRRDIG